MADFATRVDILITYAHYIELHMNQLAYSMNWGSPLLNLAGQKSANGVLPGFQRLECLWRSVENIQSWIDSFCSIAPADLVGLPCHFWSQMVMCVTVLKYLSTLGDPDWDCQAVRNTVNLISAMDRMLQRLELGGQDPALLRSGDNLFMLLSKLVRKCRVWAEAWISEPLEMPAALDAAAAAEPPGGSVETGAGGHHRGGSSIPDLDQIAMMHTMDLQSDEWFESVLGFS